MKNIIKAVLAYAFLGYVLLTILVNMTLVGALMVILPVGVVSYFIVKYRAAHRQEEVQ